MREPPVPEASDVECNGFEASLIAKNRLYRAPKFYEARNTGWRRIVGHVVQHCICTSA